MNVPDTITCALCGQQFNVCKFSPYAEITYCGVVKPDGTKCDRRFQHSQTSSEPVVMRVAPEDIEDIWQASMGL